MDLKRHNWNTGGVDRVPVDEQTMQEIVDWLFSSNERWLQEALDDPQRIQMKLRHWQARLWAKAPQVIATIEPQTTTDAPHPVTMTWPQFLAVGRKAGRLPADLATEWKARKVG